LSLSICDSTDVSIESQDSHQPESTPMIPAKSEG
jgi:hypothetical protein